jgi:hypothetical protein
LKIQQSTSQDEARRHIELPKSTAFWWTKQQPSHYHLIITCSEKAHSRIWSLQSSQELMISFSNNLSSFSCNESPTYGKEPLGHPATSFPTRT